MTEVSACEVLPTEPDRADCDFYHVMEFADGFVPKAQWDLRENVDEYLGGVNFAGRRVLEVGPASGFLSFTMERRGADVTCIEPPLSTLWDIVPRADLDLAEDRRMFLGKIERIRRSFWYAHRAFGSRIRMFEADAYRLPESLGRFDIGLLGALLLHCASPVQMINSMARHVDHTIVLTDVYAGDFGGQPVCRLVPNTDNKESRTWWQFSPRFFEQYLAVIGFTETKVRRHRQYYCVGNTWVEMFTVVAHRSA